MSARELWELFKAGLVLMSAGMMLIIGITMLSVIMTNPSGYIVLKHLQHPNEWYIEWILFILAGLVLIEDFIDRVKKK